MKTKLELTRLITHCKKETPFKLDCDSREIVKLDYSKLLKVNEHDRKLVRSGLKDGCLIEWWITSKIYDYVFKLRFYLIYGLDDIEDWINCNFPIVLTHYCRLYRYRKEDEYDVVSVEVDFDRQSIEDIIEYVDK